MSVPGGDAPPPGRWGETQPIRLRRLDQPTRPRRLLAEEFFAGPIAPAGGPSPLAHRWASGLAAAALSLTLVLSMVALALLGGGAEPGVRFSQAPLVAEGRGEPIRAVAAPIEAPADTANAPTEPAVVAPPAEDPPPAPAPVVEEPVTDEGAEGGGGTVPAGAGGDRGGAGGGGGGGNSGGGGGGGGTNSEVVPPAETGGDAVGIQPIAPVPTDTGEGDADDTPGSAGEAEDEEPQPPPEELPPCCVNEEEENGSEDEGLDSADEDEADQDEADDDEGSQENGSAAEEDLT